MRAILGAILPLIVTSIASAQAVYSHPVQEGDTLASIAQEYYDDPTREAVLREANRLGEDDAAPLVPGTWIIIPTVSYYEAKDGDSWGSIALDVYGNAERASTLIEANRGARRGTPKAGEALLIPYPLRHVVRPNEGIPRIAATYLGKQGKYARRIRRFNPGAQVQRGNVILVPIYDLRLAGPKRKEAARAFARAAGGGDDRANQQEVEQRLPTLMRRIQDGAFAEVVAEGNRLLGMGSLLSTQVVTIQRALATAYVALERQDLAEAAFRAALALQPELELDTVRTSPRVLDALDSAKGGMLPTRNLSK